MCRYFLDVKLIKSGLWCYDEDGKWKESGNGCHGNSSRNSVKTFRAFKRYVKKHSKYLPKGTTFILCSRYVDHNVLCEI